MIRKSCRCARRLFKTKQSKSEVWLRDYNSLVIIMLTGWQRLKLYLLFLWSKNFIDGKAMLI